MNTGVHRFSLETPNLELALAIRRDDLDAFERLTARGVPLYAALGVPTLVLVTFLQRFELLKRFRERVECSKTLADLDLPCTKPPFAGWRSAHFAQADHDGETLSALASWGLDVSSPPPAQPDGDIDGAEWLDAVDLINSNFFTTYVVLWSRARNKSAFLTYADPAGRTISHVAAVVGSAALVELIEELGGTKDLWCAPDLTGVTPLALAVKHTLPSVPVMSALIARGAVPSCDDLDTAMQRGYSRIVALLATAPGAPVPGGVSHRMLKGLRRDSPPLPEQERERTPFLESTVFLVEALGRATIDAVKLWLGRAAGRPEKLNLALVLAAAFGHVESVELALEAGADVNCRHDAPTAHMHRAQPLHCAAASYQSRLDVVKVLVDAGADLNGMLPCGLHVLDVCGHSDVRAWLRAQGARIALYDETPERVAFRKNNRFLVALQHQDMQGMRRAVADGANPGISDLLGTTAIHDCVRSGSVADILWLTQAGADINAQSWSGETPLLRAVGHNQIDKVDLILAAGANAAIQNCYGCCAARLALRCNNIEAWHAITGYVSANQATAAARPAPKRAARGAPPMGALRVRRHGTHTGEQLSAEAMESRAAAADAAAAFLLAEEESAAAAAALRAKRRTARRLQRERRRNRTSSEAAAAAAGQRRDTDDGTDTEEIGAAEPRTPLAPSVRGAEDSDESGYSEPEWLADLVDDFDGGVSSPAARRGFVERSVRLCASLQLQLDTVQRCVVCLESARGTLLQPCGHTHLCRQCAIRIMGTSRCCPVCTQAVTSWTHAFV